MKFLFAVPALFLLNGAHAGIVDDIVDAITNAASCAGCHALLVPLKGLAHIGDGSFVSAMTAICQALNVVDDDVCEGILRTQGPTIAYDLRSIDPFGSTAKSLCNSLLGLCSPPAVTQWKVPFPKPAPSSPKSWVSNGRAPFQVLHFSDVHIDRSYTPGADAKCSKPICCRPYADHTGPIELPAGPMGSHGCDTPTPLIQDFLRTIQPNFKFSIFTGDVIEATVWIADKGEVVRDLTRFNDELSSLPGAPIYPALGNHESAPTNLFPRNTTLKPVTDSQWIFDLQSKGWSPLINATAAAQVARISGSYAKIVPGTSLKIISINTVYWYKHNYALYDSDKHQPDPNGILSFLVQELQSAEDTGQRAWIIAHMPPGRADTFYDQSNYFDQVVQRYRNTIAAQFYGHTHKDEFVLAYTDYKKQTADNAVSVGYISATITPRSADPSFRVYDVDPDTYEVMDSRVFKADLDNPNFQLKPSWDLYYSARATYTPFISGGWPLTSPLNAKFWHKVTEAFQANDVAFQKYMELRRRGGVEECNAECKRVMICDIRGARAENGCSEYEPGLNFRRDVDGNSELHDHPAVECEGPQFGHIFSQMGTLDLIQAETLRAKLKELVPEAA